jgi:hypothetical protein
MGWLDSVGGFFKHVGEDTAHVAEDGWNTAFKAAKAGANAVGTAVRDSDAETARVGAWFDSGEQYAVDKINDGRAWLRQHGGVAGKVASDYIGFEEGVGESVYGAAKGLVQLGYEAQALSNPLEWAANPDANIARVKSAISSAEGLGKIANLVDNPTSWITNPEGNAQLATALWHSTVTSFDKDPSEFTGNAAGTIALFFIPGADAGDAGRATELAEGAGKFAEAANAGGDTGRVSGLAGDTGPASDAGGAGGAGGTGGAGGARGADDAEGAGDPAPKVKTRGRPTEQLSPTGRSNPVPLTPAEEANVGKWSRIYNTYLKTSRDTDLSALPPKIRQLIGRADNSIEHSMTPDDLAAVMKERRGITIYRSDGVTPYQHLASEWPQARLSVTKAIRAIKEQLQIVQKGSQEYTILQQKLSDLSRLLDNYETLQHAQ